MSKHRSAGNVVHENPPIERVVRPFQRFMAYRASQGILLLVCAALALLWANSGWHESYRTIFETDVAISAGEHRLSEPVVLWINDLLMAVFFFLVGLEIKREVMVGELSTARDAALPIAGALGGVLIPAGIYAAVNLGTAGVYGWGIPMATDIAFALGVMAMLGSRVPLPLQVFLTALAIVDDIAAVIAIAVFYTSQIHWEALGLGLAALGLLLALTRAGARRSLLFVGFGMMVWLAIFESGIHATIAGVLLAMAVPARLRVDPQRFLKEAREYLDSFQKGAATKKSVITDEQQSGAVEGLEELCEQVQPPLQRIEHGLQPWVGFLIMPLFALANAGVRFGGASSPNLGDSVTIGVILGLVIGKPLGITLFAWLAVRFNLASLPKDVSWSQLHGVAWLAGIGFTMSLFITNLAFQDAQLIADAKLGILLGSLIAGLVGSFLLLRVGRKQAA
jgi:NhaA family Na+:H+ antiporter